MIMFCCRGISQDVRNNNITAYSILEELSSAKFPMFFHELFVFNLFRKDDGESDKMICKLKIKNNGVEIATLPVELNFSGQERTRSIIQIGAIPFQSEGNAIFEFMDPQDNMVSSYEIELKKLELSESSTKKINENAA